MIPGWRVVGHSQAVSDFGGVSSEMERWILGGSWSEWDKLKGREAGAETRGAGSQRGTYVFKTSNYFRVPGAERGAVSTMGSADGQGLRTLSPVVPGSTRLGLCFIRAGTGVGPDLSES